MHALKVWYTSSIPGQQWRLCWTWTNLVITDLTSSFINDVNCSPQCKRTPIIHKIHCWLCSYGSSRVPLNCKVDYHFLKPNVVQFAQDTIGLIIGTYHHIQITTRPPGRLCTYFKNVSYKYMFVLGTFSFHWKQKVMT